MKVKIQESQWVMIRDSKKGSKKKNIQNLIENVEKLF